MGKRRKREELAVVGAKKRPSREGVTNGPQRGAAPLLRLWQVQNAGEKSLVGKLGGDGGT
jgi:hypothetical protein